MVLRQTTLQELQAFACQVLHDPSELRTMTVEQLHEITDELSELKIMILADICKNETVELPFSEPESTVTP